MTRICEFCSCELVLKLNTIPEESVGKPDACGTPLEAKSYPYFECPKCGFTYLWEAKI